MKGTDYIFSDNPEESVEDKKILYIGKDKNTKWHKKYPKKSKRCRFLNKCRSEIGSFFENNAFNLCLITLNHAL